MSIPLNELRRLFKEHSLKTITSSPHRIQVVGVDSKGFRHYCFLVKKDALWRADPVRLTLKETNTNVFNDPVLLAVNSTDYSVLKGIVLEVWKKSQKQS